MVITPVAIITIGNSCCWSRTILQPVVPNQSLQGIWRQNTHKMYHCHYLPSPQNPIAILPSHFRIFIKFRKAWIVVIVQPNGMWLPISIVVNIHGLRKYQKLCGVGVWRVGLITILPNVHDGRWYNQYITLKDNAVNFTNSNYIYCVKMSLSTQPKGQVVSKKWRRCRRRMTIMKYLMPK